MNTRRKTALLAAAMVTLAGAATFLATSDVAFTADAIPPYVARAVADGGRTQWDAQRDTLRKPADILAFAQIKPAQNVVDLVPDDGYYTRIIAKLVGPKGQLIALVPTGDSRGMRIAQREGIAPAEVPEDFAESCVLGCYETGPKPYMLEVDKVLAIQNISEYSNMTVMAEGLGNGDIGLPWQADVIFSADGYHELHYKDIPKLPLAVAGRNGGATPRSLNAGAIAKGAFKTLKNGGYYIVVDYAAAPGAGEVADALRRTSEDATKAEILAAGFVLDGESKVLANPADDHSKPVKGVANIRDGMDQYVLRFKKPDNAPNTDHRPTPAQENAILGNYYGNTHVLRADLKELNSSSGQRLRYHYYNADHTYQEFGRVGEGAGPMQSGLLFWDADGHSCMLHQFPIDERANTVCHDYVISRPINQMSDEYPDRANKGAKMNIYSGHIHIY